MIDERYKATYGLSPRVRFRSVASDGVMVHIESGRVIVINGVGLFIVEQLAQLEHMPTEPQVVEAVVNAFDVDKDRAASDVADFLAELETENVLIKNVGG